MLALKALSDRVGRRRVFLSGAGDRRRSERDRLQVALVEDESNGRLTYDREVLKLPE
jgi:hypothetical protein